jgi:hypothetical protein
MRQYKKMLAIFSPDDDPMTETSRDVSYMPIFTVVCVTVSISYFWYYNTNEMLKLSR